MKNSEFVSYLAHQCYPTCWNVLCTCEALPAAVATLHEESVINSFVSSIHWLQTLYLVIQY